MSVVTTMSLDLAPPHKFPAFLGHQSLSRGYYPFTSPPAYLSVGNEIEAKLVACRFPPLEENVDKRVRRKKSPLTHHGVPYSPHPSEAISQPLLRVPLLLSREATLQKKKAIDWGGRIKA